MRYLKNDRLILCVLVWVLFPVTGMAEGAEAQPQGTSAAQVLAKLLPLPDEVPRTIKNPFYADPAWKLWAINPSPVTLDKPHFKGTFKPPGGGRKYPIFLRKDSDKLTLEPLGRSLLAGFWDDCYMSLDSHHTRLGSFKNQYIDGGKMQTARDVQTLLELGVNFTSQSYADRGRAIVDDMFNNLNTERHFFFANCIRATPAHASYEDKDEAKVKDLYDGLFGHSYHSLGQSGSEMNAIHKMMAAGACMPRNTKDLLKKHGAYAIALLTIFKATLPYADGQGQALPYEHELRHRPVYSSNGNPSHIHYCPANVYYHGYDEHRHLQGMMDMARGLVSAPPVAVAHLLNFSVKKGDGTICDQADLAKKVKCISLTNVRFWGGQNETLEALVNLNKSYDLQDRTLSFKCQALYPNQKNVSITEKAPGIFLIRVQHDQKLPKGRIPVICTASNGLAVPSNPVFINFYWPGEKETDDYFTLGGLPKDVRAKYDALGLKRLPVTVNSRPVVDFNFTGDALQCLPGQTVSIDLKARDPEGFPVTVFRRSGEIGTIEQGRFTASIPSTNKDTIHYIHFIFSDGTGGYTGKQIKLLVAKEKDTLPDGWSTTTLGPVQRAIKVSHDASTSTFTFGRQPLDRQIGHMQGTFVLRPVSEAADLICRIPQIGADTDLALMITNTLDDFSRRIGVGFFKGKIACLSKASERSGAAPKYQWDDTRSDKPEYFRLTWHDNIVAAYMSTDGRAWEQIMDTKMGFLKQCYSGLIHKGDPWATGVCEWIPTSGAALPILTTGKKTMDKEGMYDGPLEITVTSPDQDIPVHYTVDGSEPTAKSQLYEKSITLTKPGQYEIRVKTFEQEGAQGTAVATYHIKP